MVTKNSTTITLTGTEQTVQFDRAYPYFWVQNLGDSDVSISIDSGIVAGADGVITVPAGGSCGTMHGYTADRLYLLGKGKVQVMGTGSAFNPFKAARKGGDVGKTVSGSSAYTLENAVDYPIMNLKLYGKSTQDGTPTPDAPVDIVSVGDSGTVNITSNNGGNISVTAAITSALPLCGIPVTSNGNYTDSTGQQWICDELIYNADGSGKIVKNLFSGTKDNLNYATAYIAETDNYAQCNFIIKNSENYARKASPYLAICNILSWDSRVGAGKYDCIGIQAVDSLVIMRLDKREFPTISDFNDYLNNNNIKFIWILETPQEISLTAAEMTELRQLMTYSGTTNITNSDNADMDVKYCTNKNLSECVIPITTALQAQIDELKSAVLSLGSNV